MISNFTSTKTTRFGRGGAILRSATALDDDTIKAVAPSVFAENAHGSRSEKYTYIPTSEVLRGLRKEGFMPFEVRQGGSRDDEKRGFTKHMLRLRHQSLSDSENLRELILLNAHDGTSSYQLMSGVFRTVCQNGLIVAEGDAQMLRVAHKGDIVGQVIEGAYQIIDDSHAVTQAIANMREVQLSEGEQKVFAEAALQLRFDEGKAPNIDPLMLTRPRRAADAGNDLWRTFNRTQENLINGGINYTHYNAAQQRSRRETRPVNSIDGNVTLNRALWTLAERMKELKAA